MSKQTEEIRRRLAAATPGPWRVGHDGPSKPIIIPQTVTDLWGFDDLEEENAELIAHAPTDLAFLLAENERLEREVAFQSETSKRQNTRICELLESSLALRTALTTAGRVIAERLLAEVRRLRARERELHNRIRLEFVQHGSKLDWWVCQECGETGPSPERHAFVNGKPCLAAPLPKEDEG